MKKLIIVLLLIPLLESCQNRFNKIFQDADSAFGSKQSYVVASLQDSIKYLNGSIRFLNDSIVKLNQRPLMTEDQFIRVYKYERLYKYYQICANKPSQWVYYKGWSIRVFTQ